MANQITRFRFVVCLATIFLQLYGLQAEEKISYRRQIAPVLQTYCLGCHNRIDAEQELSLQAADDILRGSEKGAILDAQHPEESRLWKVLMSEDDNHMPPADQPQLSPEDLKTIQTWLKEGAAFDSRAAVMAALPDVKVSADSVRNPALSMAISH